MCWGLWSVRKRPNAVFPEREQEKKSREPQRQSTKEPPRSRQGAVKEHTFGSNGPRDAQERVERTKRTARDMGRGMRTGSHTPWAQGPANLLPYESP